MATAPADDRLDALDQQGWTAANAAVTAGASQSVTVTYTHGSFPGHRILVTRTGAGWQHLDPAGLLIGHSRYGTKLSDHLRDRHQH